MQAQHAEKIKKGFVDALMRELQVVKQELVKQELKSIRALTLDEHGFNVHTEDKKELSHTTRRIVQQACVQAFRLCFE